MNAKYNAVQILTSKYKQAEKELLELNESIAKGEIVEEDKASLLRIVLSRKIDIGQALKWAQNADVEGGIE